MRHKNSLISRHPNSNPTTLLIFGQVVEPRHQRPVFREVRHILRDEIPRDCETELFENLREMLQEEGKSSSREVPKTSVMRRLVDVGRQMRVKAIQRFKVECATIRGLL